MMQLFDIMMVAVIGAVAARSVVLTVFALLDVAARRRCPATKPETWPPLTVIVPAYNEEKVLLNTVSAILAADYPDITVVVVDDGSTDRTAEIAQAMSQKESRLRLVRHANNHGKAVALNTGIEATGSGLIVTVDADTVPERGAFRHLVARMLASEAVAVAGNIKVGNRNNLLTIFQNIEYVANLNLDRRAQSWVGAITTVPGALTVWRREAVVEAGGFSADTPTEDADLTLELARRGMPAEFEDRAIGYTEAPERLVNLARQRRRWLYGNLLCAVKHRHGWVGPSPALRWFGLPNFWFSHLFVYFLFPLALTYLPRALEVLSLPTLLFVSGGLFSFDILLAVLAHRLEGRLKLELAAAPLQRLFLPFFLWVVFIVVVGRFLTGRRVRWRDTPRTGGVLLPASTRR
jgi:cellulose synthase/poly-beta-1,6-N-acetylglucosamine synthase-like glycosyltransferase